MLLSRSLRRLLIAMLLAALAGCTRLETPAQSGELVIGLREAPGFYQAGEDGGSGYEYDLLMAFAASANLKPRLVTAADPAALKELAQRAKVHLAAAMPLAEDGLSYSVPIRRVGQRIVGRDDDFGPESLDDLSARTVLAVAGSPLAATLRGLAKPPVVVEVADVTEMDILETVAGERGTLAAVHDLNFNLAVNFFPELRGMVDLPGQIELGWAFAGPAAASLKAQADAFIAQAQADGTLAKLHDRYFGHLRRITTLGVAEFLDATRTRLPQWRRDFQAAEEITGLDWRLIAAVAYQESKWDPLATSPTNVRGMMMLTEDTADHLGVKNRLDGAESIRAGARYLLALMEQVPESTPHPDRLWLALAAYNMGMGHLRGGLAIAKSMKRDPDSWYEMKQVLPQLARPEVYARLKSGRARGGEAVIMVENIRTFYDILSRFEPAHITPFPKPLLRSR